MTAFLEEDCKPWIIGFSSSWGVALMNVKKQDKHTYCGFCHLVVCYEQMAFNHGFVNQLQLEDSSVICTAVILHYNCFGFTWLTLSIADGYANCLKYMALRHYFVRT